MVGWEVCCGVELKEAEVTGWRVQKCKWLSAKPADKTEQKLTRTRNSRKWRKSRNSQDQEQQTKMHKTRSTKDPAKCGKNKKSQEFFFPVLRTKPRKQNNARSGEEARESAPLKCAMNTGRRQEQAKQLLAVLDVLSCNVVHAYDRKESLPSAWLASKHSCRIVRESCTKGNV